MKRSSHVVSLAIAGSLAVVTGSTVRAADPTTADCLSANDQAISLRNDHKLIAARTQLLVCAASSCPSDVRKECIRRIDQINASMPTIVFEPKDGQGNDLTAVRVKMDGEVLAEHLEGMAIPLDPGAHTFTFEVAGQDAVTKQIVVHEGQKDRHEVIVVGKAAAHPPSEAAPVAATPTIAIPGALPEPSTSGAATERTIGLVALGVGVVGLGVGTVFGLQAMSKHNDANKVCPGACSDRTGVDLWDDARSKGNVATVGFIVGGVGLAAGGILWLTAKSGDSASVRVGAGPSSLQVRGDW